MSELPLGVILERHRSCAAIHPPAVLHVLQFLQPMPSGPCNHIQHTTGSPGSTCTFDCHSPPGHSCDGAALLDHISTRLEAVDAVLDELESSRALSLGRYGGEDVGQGPLRGHPESEGKLGEEEDFHYPLGTEDGRNFRIRRKGGHYGRLGASFAELPSGE